MRSMPPVLGCKVGAAVGDVVAEGVVVAALPQALRPSDAIINIARRMVSFFIIVPLYVRNAGGSGTPVRLPGGGGAMAVPPGLPGRGRPSPNASVGGLEGW